MKEKLHDHHLEDIIIPKTGVGCRRPTPGFGYLEALTSGNVDVVYGDIKRIAVDGCVDSNDVKHQVEVLICATGFDTSYVPRFPIIGEDGKNLQDQWAEEAKAYLALAATGFPNYLIFYGPSNPFASGPFLSTIGKYIRSWDLSRPSNLTKRNQRLKRTICSHSATGGKQRTYIRSLLK